MFLISKICASLISDKLYISNAFHSFIVGMLMALGGNTLQAVSRADVQLVRTLFDAAQKAHG